MKRKAPKFKLTMSHEYRAALWLSIDLMAFVVLGEIDDATFAHSERVSQKLSACDDIIEPLVIEFTVRDFLAAVTGLEYARLYLDGIHKHFSAPVPQQIQSELYSYESAIRNLRNDFLWRKREAGI